MASTWRPRAAGAIDVRTPDLNGALLVGAGIALLVLLGALNPLQGSRAAGVASLLFVLVPLSGFFIGRALGDDALGTFVRLVGVFGLIVALYGLSQTIYGFTGWDSAWIQQQ